MAAMNPWVVEPQTVVFFLMVLPVVYFVYWRLANRRLLQLADKIPGPPGLPLLGNLLEFRGSPTEIFNNLMELSCLYKDIARVWFGHRLFVFLYHPADIELILSSTEHTDKSLEYGFLRPWIGDGIFTISGRKWFSHQKILASSFNINVLRSFFDKFNENAKITIERLAKELGNEFDCRNYMCEFTLNTLLETLMGVDKEEMKYMCPAYSEATTNMSNLVHLRHTKIYYRADILFNCSKYGFEQRKFLSLIHNFSRKILKIRKSQREIMSSPDINNKTMLKNSTGVDRSSGLSNGHSETKKEMDLLGAKKRYAFLDTLLEKEGNKEIFSEKDVLEEIDTFLFEGHDTTAGAISMFLCIMGANPEIQAKCAEELDNILGNPDCDVTYQDTLKMKYLECCIMEAMRLYSPVPIVSRKLKTEVKLATNNITLPANTTVIVTIIKLHRREDIYPNPEKFNPDNFLQEKTSSRNYYSFIPFSAGPRSCLGRKYFMLKMKVILAFILRKYEVTTCNPPEKWKFQADISLKKIDGYKIKLNLRKNYKI